MPFRGYFSKTKDQTVCKFYLRFNSGAMARGAEEHLRGITNKIKNQLSNPSPPVCFGEKETVRGSSGRRRMEAITLIIDCTCKDLMTISLWLTKQGYHHRVAAADSAAQKCIGYLQKKIGHQ